MDENFEAILGPVLDALADRVAERMQSPPKELWSASDIAERWGVTPASVRQKMAAGEFGPLVHVDKRTRLVPWHSIMEYENAHLHNPQRRTRARRTAVKHRADPGPI